MTYLLLMKEFILLFIRGLFRNAFRCLCTICHPYLYCVVGKNKMCCVKKSQCLIKIPGQHFCYLKVIFFLKKKKRKEKKQIVILNFNLVFVLDLVSESLPL